MTKRAPIKARLSSITGMFVRAIIPHVDFEGPSEGLNLFGIESDKCAYCGDRQTDWDHFYPMVKGKRPSGYFHCANNLVPACGPCNQSKSGHAWKDWMLGKAKGSPASRNISDVQERVARLEKFEVWGKLSPIPEEEFEAVVGKDRWANYWARLEEIRTVMEQAQIQADEIRLLLESRFANRKAPIT